MPLKASDAYALTLDAYTVKHNQLEDIYSYISERARLGYDYAGTKDIYNILKIQGSTAMQKNISKSICAALKAEGYKISKSKISWKV